MNDGVSSSGRIVRSDKVLCSLTKYVLFKHRLAEVFSSGKLTNRLVHSSAHRVISTQPWLTNLR